MSTPSPESLPAEPKLPGSPLSTGLPGAVVSVGGRPMAVFDFTVRGGRVVGIELLADPETLGALDLEPVPSGPKQFFDNSE